MRGVVAAGHEVTARAAELVLREGGNAFDAAVAAAFAASVAEPALVSLGGGGHLLARAADGRVLVYDFFAHTPRVKRPERQLDLRSAARGNGSPARELRFGRGTIATPGMVRGLFAIGRELGSVPMRELVGPALESAREGVVVNGFQGANFRSLEPIFTATPEARAAFARKDAGQGVVREGDRLRQPDLADALDVLAREGDDLFYRGEIARSIDALGREGGSIGMEDLERYEAVRRKPLAADYRGCRVLTNPPPSAGGLWTALALALLGAVRSLRELRFGSHAYLDLLAHVIGCADDARDRASADPASRREDASPGLDERLVARYRDEVARRARCHRGTTHVSVVDERGNVAALSASNGEGSGVVVPATGIMLNNMLGDEDLVRGEIHRWEPNQRMSSLLTPTIVQWPDGRLLATGSGGSARIAIAVLHVLILVLDYGMPLEVAVRSPRLALEGETLHLEDGFDEGQLARLAPDYPQRVAWPELSPFFGGAHTVASTAGGVSGAGDPRRGGACATS